MLPQLLTSSMLLVSPSMLKKCTGEGASDDSPELWFKQLGTGI